MLGGRASGAHFEFAQLPAERHPIVVGDALEGCERNLREVVGDETHLRVILLLHAGLGEINVVDVAAGAVGEQADEGRRLPVRVQQLLEPVAKNREVIRRDVPRADATDVVQRVVR
ncbi:MAG: hypothetical protein EB034_16235 [Verrucomicrobia bacterium]|nr:hypothetical protein [Verrucomicrobiota bacterium]